MSIQNDGQREADVPNEACLIVLRSAFPKAQWSLKAALVPAHQRQATGYSHAGSHLEHEAGASGAEERLSICFTHARHAKAKRRSVVVELVQRRSIVSACAARRGFWVNW